MDTDRVSKSDAAEQVVSMCRRLAQLYISFAKTLVEEFGEQRGKEVILQAISRYGQDIGRRIKEKVEAQGLPLTIENYRRSSDLPSLGFNTEPLVAEGERRTRIHECVLASVWKGLGEEELGRLYCFVDQAKAEGYNPELEFLHLKNCLEGDLSYCETTLRRKEERPPSLP